MVKQKREPVYMVQEWIECPKCHGYGVVPKIIDFETQAWPCDNCGEDGHLIKDVPLEEALRNLGIVFTQETN